MAANAVLNTKTSAMTAGLAACLIWAICNIINKYLLDIGIAPLTLLVGQLLVSTPFLWLVTFAAGRRPGIAIVVRLMLLGVLQPGLAYGLSIVGLTMTSATVEALLFSTETLFIIALAWPMLGERPNPLIVAAAVIGSVGVALVSAGGDAVNAAPSGVLGPLLILAGVLAAALYSVQLRREAETIDPLSLIAASQTGGLVIVIIAWAIWPEPARLDHLTAHTIPLVALSGILMHALAFVLFATQLKRIRADTAGLILLTTPVMTGGFAYWLLGDRLNGVQMAGAIIVLISVVALVRAKT